MLNYINVIGRIANTPLLIDKDKLSILNANVLSKLLMSEKLDTGISFAPPVRESVQTIDSKVALINVFDTLVSKNGAGASGFTSYESIKTQVMDAINQQVNVIGFRIDSPGGEAKGLFGLTDFIHSIPSTYGIETFSFVEGSATSAAYAIARSAQKIYSTVEANLGSIAAIVSLVDVTEADKKNGIKYTIIRSKEDKALYNPHEKLSEKVIEKATESLQVIDTMFNNAISTYSPNLTIDKINGLKGDSFHASKALEIGLVDEIVPGLEDVLKLYGNKGSKTNPSTSRGNKMATLEELNTQISALVAENSTLKESVANAVTKAVEQERTRCSEIFKAGVELKGSSDLISKRLSAGSSKEDSLDIFTAIAAAPASFYAIYTSTASSFIVDLSSKEQETRFKLGEGFEATASAILAAAKGVK